jgi:kumamolisin
MRQIPDVALDADPRTGYSIYATESATTGWFLIGGTSAAAPAWAAITSLLNQFRATYDRPALGFANPTLYRLGSAPPLNLPFHDVITGDNLYYPATAAWDYATGWGSLDAYNLTRAVGTGRLPTLPVSATTSPSGRIAPAAVPQSGSTSRSPARTQAGSARPALAPATIPSIQALISRLMTAWLTLLF